MDIDNFRWILVGFGVVLVAGIYIREGIRYRLAEDSKRQTEDQPGLKAGDFSLQATRSESEESLELPSIRNDRFDSIPTERVALTTEPEIEAAVLDPDNGSPESDNPFGIVQIKVAAHEGMCFSGKLLIHALSAAGLEYGSRKVFHKPLGNSQLPLFSVVNMVEPGIFPKNEANCFESPGVVFFLQVATLTHPLDAFDEMLRTVHVLAARMGGEIRDAENRLLSVEKTESIREFLAPVAG